MLGSLLPSTEIVYVKAGNVSEFRNKPDLLKSRAVNDFHHAQDAYLNIVVGNTYHTKFTKNPINFIRAYRKERKTNEYHMDKMFQYDVVRDGVVAWQAGERGTIITVRRMMAKNTPLVTKRTYEKHGGIADQTIYSAKEANAEYYIPVKTNNSRLGDVTKYGGFSSVSGAYYFLVEHEKKGKQIRTLEQIPIYLKEKLEMDEEALKEYCCANLKLVNPVIRVRKKPIKSLVKRNGYWMRLSGRTGNRIAVDNDVPLCLSQAWVNYIKRLETFKESGREKDCSKEEKKKISVEKNLLLFQELLQKHTGTIYQRKPNPLGKKLIEKQEVFGNLFLREQGNTLLELLKITQSSNLNVEVKEIGLKSSPAKIPNEVSSQNEFLLINQSITGIYTSVIDLKTI